MSGFVALEFKCIPVLSSRKISLRLVCIQKFEHGQKSVDLAKSCFSPEERQSSFPVIETFSISRGIDT